MLLMVHLAGRKSDVAIQVKGFNSFWTGVVMRDMCWPFGLKILKNTNATKIWLYCGCNPLRLSWNCLFINMK